MENYMRITVTTANNALALGIPLYVYGDDSNLHKWDYETFNSLYTYTGIYINKEDYEKLYK